MTRLARLLRYWHTLKYLRPIQFYGRLYFKLARPRIDLRVAPALRAPQAAWQAPARRQPSLMAARRMCFLGESHDLDEVGWDAPRLEKLWRYNQHYFDDLNAENCRTRASWHLELIDDWIRCNPPASGSGWEPYPTSLRVVNWIKWHLSGQELSEKHRQSLAVQVRWLQQRLEWHLLGNHLFANAKALLMAGMVFDGPEADGWLRQGLAILATELPEQVLPDGGNFERSPMYHAIFLEDLLDLLNTAQVFAGRVLPGTLALWRQTSSRMLAWMLETCHPDGEISFFNDAAIGIAPPPASLQQYAARLGLTAQPLSAPDDGLSMKLLADSGYVRVQDGDMRALLDVAAVGPDYLPGHAHADTLSFEMSVFGERVIVNGGTSRYGLSDVRLRERGTAAHSTLVINGQDSSEVWGGFRVARRARPFQLVTQASASAVSVGCSHDGYGRLPGAPIHRREWQFTDRKVTVKDLVTGPFSSAESYFHFHPKVQVERCDEQTLALRLASGRLVRMKVLLGTLHLEPSQYAPTFGVVLASQCARVSAHESQVLVELNWI